MPHDGSVETHLYRTIRIAIAGPDRNVLAFCTKNIRAWSRRHGADQGVDYRWRREHLETIVPQITSEEQVGWKHNLTNAAPLWR
jgi:hypothetical protein